MWCQIKLVEGQAGLRRGMVRSILDHAGTAAFLAYRDGGYVRHAVLFGRRHLDYVLGLGAAGAGPGGVELEQIAEPAVLGECHIVWEMEMAGCGGAPLPDGAGTLPAAAALGARITDAAYRLVVCQRARRSPVVREWERSGGRPASIYGKAAGMVWREAAGFLGAFGGRAARRPAPDGPEPMQAKPPPYTYARIILGAGTKDHLDILRDTFPARSLRRRRALRPGDVPALAASAPRVPLGNAVHFPVFSDDELDSLGIIPEEDAEVPAERGRAAASTTRPPVGAPYIADLADGSEAPGPDAPFLAGGAQGNGPPRRHDAGAGLPGGQTVIGYVNDRCDPAVPLDTITIPEEHRLHTLVLGSTGSGKSTILKQLILQNLRRGDGVAILDPHHDLAEWAARRIPKWRANQLVYVSPAQLSRTGRAVPINPLESRGAPAQAAAEFAETLLGAFGTKGVQMHQILREAATSLMAADRGGLGLLRRIILDRRVRDEVLAGVHIRDNLDFWSGVFPRMAKEAVTHVDNKITPITSNPAVGPFFEGDTSFDMARLVDGGGILVFDGAGCTSDGERTLFATFLLNKITAAATDLAQSRPRGSKPVPFHLYIDEVEMLESSRIREMLQQVRKLGIRMTLATQQLDTMDRDNAVAMAGNCDLYLVGRCTPGTAKMVAPKMGVEPDTLAAIPKYQINFHMSLPGDDIRGSHIRTRDMDGAIPYWDSLEEIVDHSLRNYGIDVDMDRYANRPAVRYDVTPLEMAILCALYHNMGGLDLDGVCSAAARFSPAKRRVAQLLKHMERRGLVEAVSDGGSATYALSPACVDRHFDTTALGGRAGGDLHIRTISAMQDRYSRYGYYTRMDTGGVTHPMPDLEVCEPAIGPDGAPDPERWGRRVAVEVETGPSRHPNRPGAPGQVHANWKKSCGAMGVWFIAYTEGDRRVIGAQLGEMGVGPDGYDVTVVPEGAEGDAVPAPPGFAPAEPLPGCSALSELERVILDAVPPGGLRTAELRGMVPSVYGDREVAEAADSLVASGLLGSGRRGRWDALFRK